MLGWEFTDEGERRIVSMPTVSPSDLTEAEHIAELVEVFFNNRTVRSLLLLYSSYSEKNITIK